VHKMTLPAFRPTLLSGPVLLLALLAAAGCQEQAAPSRTRVFAVDMNGRAKSCIANPTETSPSKPADAMMSLSNDGGWCGITTRQENRRPYAAGLVETRPAHGMVFIHTVGDDTRVDFVPDAGFTGQDKFSVRLVPGNAKMNVAVTVTPR